MKNARKLLVASATKFRNVPSVWSIVFVETVGMLQTPHPARASASSAILARVRAIQGVEHAIIFSVQTAQGTNNAMDAKRSFATRKGAESRTANRLVAPCRIVATAGIIALHVNTSNGVKNAVKCMRKLVTAPDKNRRSERRRAIRKSVSVLLYKRSENNSSHSLQYLVLNTLDVLLYLILFTSRNLFCVR